MNKEEFKRPKTARFKSAYCDIAGRLKAAGFSLEDIGYAFGVSKTLISKWMKIHPSFKEALEDGKEVARSHVVATAFMAACGYDYDESNEKFDSAGELKETSVFHKHQAPNPKLIMWLLCNLSPETWKSEHKILVEKDDTVHVKLDGKMASKQIEELADKLFSDKSKKVDFQSKAPGVDSEGQTP